ncbi:ligase [Lithospermum erythrorhizon]|uniref:Ligase n=1 Tax=Lithospermum erythrorhizon TaxID=34254 RepID=A0AAV3QZE8_LITER
MAGHAFEAKIYAEKVRKGFLPATETLHHYCPVQVSSPDNATLAENSSSALIYGSSIVAACIYEKQLARSRLNAPRPLSIWYARPNFRLNHCARTMIELECEDDGGVRESACLQVGITCLPDGKYIVESPGLEIQLTHLGNDAYQVKIGGVSRRVTLAEYAKDESEHIHIWDGPNHYHFKQKLGNEHSDTDDGGALHKSISDVTSHPPGTVVAPMAGLVVKVLVKDGARIEEGQPILVLEAMKMEHVLKAPNSWASCYNWSSSDFNSFSNFYEQCLVVIAIFYLKFSSFRYNGRYLLFLALWHRVFVATWNMAGKSPPNNLRLEEWLHTSPPADIYVLGFQEIVPLNAGNVFGHRG